MGGAKGGGAKGDESKAGGAKADEPREGATDADGPQGGVAKGPTVHDDHSYRGPVPILFTCLCSPGYHGQRCEIVIPICVPTG